MLTADPAAVIGKAMENLRRWAQRSDDGLSPASQEWLEILTHRSPDEIADLLVSDDENAVRLRQSTPFAGVLTPREVWSIKRSHEAA